MSNKSQKNGRDCFSYNLARDKLNDIQASESTQ